MTTPTPCDHDKRFSGVLFLPKGTNGCLACAYEKSVRDLAAAQEALSEERNVSAWLSSDVTRLGQKLQEAQEANKRMMARLAPSIETVEGIPAGYGEDEIDRLEAQLKEAQEALAELKRGKVLADGMANTVRGFILKRAERETLDEVAAEYRRWEEDYCHRNFRKPKP